MRKLATKVSNHELAPEDITEEMISKNLDTWELPDPDLLIRTSGEPASLQLSAVAACLYGILLYRCTLAGF